MLETHEGARRLTALSARAWLSLAMGVAIGCSDSVPPPSPVDTESSDKVVQAYLKTVRPIFADKYV